jgi:hypothetical protein
LTLLSSFLSEVKLEKDNTISKLNSKFLTNKISFHSRFIPLHEELVGRWMETHDSGVLELSKVIANELKV